MLSLLKMEAISIKRNSMAVLLGIGIPILFFLLFSSIVTYPDKTSQAIFVKNYMLSMTAFSMSGIGLMTLPHLLEEDKTNNWTALVGHLPLPAYAYLQSKFIRMIIYFASSIFVTFLVGAFVKGVEMSAWSWFVSALLLLAMSVFYILGGLLLSLLPSQQMMAALGNIFYFVLAILGGSWMPVETFPQWMQDLAQYVPTYHINQILYKWANSNEILGKSLLIFSIYVIIMGGTLLWFSKKIGENRA